MAHWFWLSSMVLINLYAFLLSFLVIFGKILLKLTSALQKKVTCTITENGELLN